MGATGFARDLDLLEAIASVSGREHRGVRLTELAGITGREKSQVSRALARLEAAGLVARDDTSREYVLGWRLFQLASLTAEAQLIGPVRPAMRKIVALLSETVHLCVLRGTSCITVHSEVPPHGFRGLGWVGVEAPAHTLTAGRVLLADLSDEDIRSLYPTETLRDLPPTCKIRTRAQLLAECDRIRSHHYALVDEEFEAGLVGASAAIYDFRNIAVASLNVAAPKARLGAKLDALGEHLARVAAGVSQALGAPRSAGQPDGHRPRGTATRENRPAQPG
jgi:DNA-binding IclR family transcriptional regulator